MPHLKALSGIEWNYDLEGEGDGVLLFLHGWGVDKRIWRQQAKYFSQFYKVMTIDLPGHGESSWIKVSLEVMSQDIDYILDNLSIKELSVVGSSLGALLALRFYKNHPQKFKSLVLVGSMPKFTRSDDYPFGLDVHSIRKLSTQLENAYPSIVNIFFRSLFTHEERQSRRFKWLQTFRQNDGVPMKKALMEYLDLFEHEDLRGHFKDIKIPVQIINGEEDQICTKETVLFMRSELPQTKVYFFEQCGHFPFLSKPHEFNQILSDFLKQIHYGE